MPIVNGGYVSPKWKNNAPPAISAQELNAMSDTISEMSSRNLLDNWYFANPVNQRGANIISSAHEYGIDRWKTLSYTSGNVSFSDGKVTINGTLDFGEILLSSALPNTPNLPITISAMLEDGSIIAGSGTLNNDGTTQFVSVNYGNGFLNYIRNWTSTQDLFYFNNHFEAISVVSVKLELGSVSTLANDAPPNYATELAKCLTYYQPIGKMYCNTNADGWIELPIHFSPMSKTPTISVAYCSYFNGAAWVAVNPVISDVTDRSARCGITTQTGNVVVCIELVAESDL